MTTATDLQKLQTEFRAIYQSEPRVFRAPGRVNLIGEHTDYNGGFVLPMAIEQATFVAAAAREDRKIRVRSGNFNQSDEIDLDAPEQKMRGSWLDYVEGVARVLERTLTAKNPQNGGAQPEKLRGADLLIWSNVPSGAGLSSSAALEISVGLALAEISGAAIDKKTLALAGQTAEHEFVGAKVGIMDQFISAMGRAFHALLIDCRSLEAEQIPFETGASSGGTVVAICNSNVKHKLAASEYNARRAECEQGVELLKKFLPRITQLRDVGVADFERYESSLPEIVRRRCRHVITENARTLAAAAALKQDDLTEFGRLMRLSHASLRDDYEVSCAELDALVEIADECAGVLGARMTGGGFGGSTVNLVRRENLDEFVRKISAQYKRRTGKETNVYVSGAADGASEITNS